MNKMMAALHQLYRMVVEPPPSHPVVEQAERSSDRSVQQSREVDRQADNFSAMVRGMRGEPRIKSARGRK